MGAAAGYGKTTAVRQLLSQVPSRWFTRADWTRALDRSGAGTEGARADGAAHRTDPAGERADGAADRADRAGERADGAADRAGERAGAALAELLRPVINSGGWHGLWLVLDDVGRLPRAQLRAVVEVAVRLPDRLRLVILTRRPPAPETVANWCRRGILGVLGPADLALSRGEVATLLRDRYHLPDPLLAGAVHRATAGWPALVHLLAGALLDGGAHEPDPTALPGVSGPAEAFLLQEVFPELPAEVSRVLRRAARLDPVPVGLLGGVNPDRTGRLLRRLADTGLLGPPRPDGSGYPAIPLVAHAVRRHLPLPAAEADVLHGRAVDWYTRHGLPAATLRSHRLAGAAEDAARLLGRCGAELLARGEGAAVVAAVEALPPARRSAPLRRLHGDALRLAGEADAAIEVYRALAGRGPALSPGLAWRYGLVHLLRGEPLAAIEVFDRASLGDERSVDEALLLGWAGCAYAMCGDVAAGTDRARRAMAAGCACAGTAPPDAGAVNANRPDAPVSGPTRVVGPTLAMKPAPAVGRAPVVAQSLAVGQALATGYAAAGLAAMLAGDRQAALGRLGEALRLAGAVGDVGLVAWIRINRAVIRLGEARYPEAVTEATAAVEIAEAAGYAPMLALALAGRGTGLARLGRLDEALASHERSVSLHQRIGSAQVAVPLVGLGQLHLLCGRDSLARVAYEEAVRISEPRGNLPALVPALAGLARVTAKEDPAGATALAAHAVDLARGPDATAARCALGWAAVSGSDLSRATGLAAEAEQQARLYQDRAGLAEALRLRAAATDDLRLARQALTEAGAILTEIGARVDADRLSVLLGRLPGASAPERIDAQLAAARLAEAGAAAPTPARPGERISAVEVRTLGRFEVRVGGRAVPSSAWQSRKGRDLLRILAARRGRPVSREQLGELLWPGEEPSRIGHRLSVLLSLLRGVLDPERHGPVDRYVVAERASMALDLEHVELDVELFQAEALLGLRRFDRGEATGAHDVLALAEQRYHGDFLVDDPYDDWTVPIRDEMRRLYLRVVRALAELARHRGDLEQAAHHLRRALACEPYDERTHEDLIAVLTAAGRHGEADEAGRRYRRAMAVIGVPLRPVRTSLPPGDRVRVPADSP